MSELISVEVFFEKPKITFRYSDHTEKHVNLTSETIARKSEAELSINQADINAAVAGLVKDQKASIDALPVEDKQKAVMKQAVDSSESLKRIEGSVRGAMVDTRAREIAGGLLSGMIDQLRAAAVKIGG